MIKLRYPELLFERKILYKISEGNTTSHWKEFEPKSLKILLIYEEKEACMSEAVKQMLVKLVVACGYSENERLLINLTQRNISFSNIQNTLQPEMVLVFGDVKLGGNISSLAPNHPVSIGEVVFIKTDSPVKLTTDEKGKAALWKGIKEGLKLIR